MCLKWTYCFKELGRLRDELERQKAAHQVCQVFNTFILSSLRAERVGPKGLRAERARAVTGRRCPHSGDEDMDIWGHSGSKYPNFGRFGAQNPIFFRKKIRLTCQKVFPLPTVGAPSASNSPSALSKRAG